MKNYIIQRAITRVYLNTWEHYNDGYLGYGWKTPEDALAFIESNPERDGGEWFIADIDDYLGIDLPNLNYRNVTKTLELLIELENMQEFERDCLIAVMHHNDCFDLEEAKDIADGYIFYKDWEAYHESCDEGIFEGNNNELLERYFDFEAYHRDCDYDATEAPNGIILVG